MPNNLQFLDDPDDVPFINENITLYVGVDGSDDENSGLTGNAFRSLGKAVDVVRNKIVGKTNMVTIQLGAIQSNPDGTGKKYFEEEDINIDFESARRLKIKGVKPTNHEVVGISYYDKAPDKEGYYCQILVTNQDKISIGDYIGIYDHLKIKKGNPSYYWVRNNIKSSLTRMVTPNNCYIDAIRGDMILGVHEVVDVGSAVDHDGIYASTSTEIFSPVDLKVGVVTVCIKNNNFTYRRLNEVPFWNSLGTKGGDPIYTYAGGPGNSPLQAAINNHNVMPPIFYGAAAMSNPQTIESQGFEPLYFSNPVQQIEIVDIMIRGYRLSIKSLDNKITDPRFGKLAKNATLLWDDKNLTGQNRIIVASTIAAYFYKKLIDDLQISGDLPYYFGRSTDPFIKTSQIVKAAKKLRDYLLSGARLINGVPPWDEENHPGYGYGPFESGVARPPLGSGATNIDKGSYPTEYSDPNKLSLLLQYYNLYPPINGQLYGPTLVKRILSWYNDNATQNGLQLDRWEKKGNQSPFFCGYITPQGWFKQRYVTNIGNTLGSDIPSLKDITDPNGYHRLFGGIYPNYVANDNTAFNKIIAGAKGVFSNERDATKNQYWIEPISFQYEASGLTASGGYSYGNTAAYTPRGSMGSVWYSGSVNFLRLDNSTGSGRGVGQMGAFALDRYSLAYQQDSPTTTNDAITSKSFTGTPQISSTLEIMYSAETTNLRAKCFKTVLRFGGNGIKVIQKAKLGLIKDVCLVNFGQQVSSKRTYGLMADQESVINASNIAVSSFSCGISARNQSLVNLLADLGDSDNIYHKNMFAPIDPAAIVTGNEIGIESALKSHINARRTVSTGSKSANYLAVASSSIDCSNSMSSSGFKHGYVCEFNSYMKALNSFSEFNGGVGYCAANNSILICHRSRSIWNGYHGLYATNSSTAKCYEFISRSNGGDGILAQGKSVVSAGANSSKSANYRKEITSSRYIDPTNASNNNSTYASLPPHLFQVKVVTPDIEPILSLPSASVSINSNPTHGTNVLYHECNSTISEFNAGSGFASETDSLIVADNTISRYNSKRYGEFFIYGWSGIRGCFPTDTFSPYERGTL